MKNIRIILTIIICINIIITILLLTIQKKDNYKSDEIMGTYGIEEYESKELGFANSKELVSSIKSTNFKASKLMQYIQIYVQESLPKIYNEIIIGENINLNQYFTENTEFLSNTFGINTVDELQKFKKDLENTKINFNNHSKVSFIENTGTSDKRKFSIKVKVFYENGSAINLYMMSDINYEVKFEIIEEE